MGKLLKPQVYLIGYTGINMDGLEQYLTDTGNEEFLDDMKTADAAGLSEAEQIVSFYAKLCYLSLTIGKNDNISKTRSILNNLIGCHESAHGSVYRHAHLNFVIHNGSRVLECEMLRHTAGVKHNDADESDYSIQSGRYTRMSHIDFVFDPILEPVKDEITRLLAITESFYDTMIKKLNLNEITDMHQKKMITSALRRIMPEGKAKEIGFTVNLQSIRHTVQLRTSRQAEWEIREIFGQVYQLTKEKFPLLFYGAKEEIINNQLEVSGMKMQPYEK
jgi:thymidylate synthase ThyX